MELKNQILSNELTFEMKRLIRDDKAAIIANELHSIKNQLYCGKPYILHLGLAVNKAIRHLRLIPTNDHQIIVDSIWLHDTIEDCEIDYDYIAKGFGHYVAENVQALTNKPNGMYNHKAILNQHYARFIKLCDRISHIEVNMEIIKHRTFFRMENKEFMFYDAQKYLKKYIDQDKEFRKKLAINDESSVDDFEKSLVEQYKNLITKYLTGQ